MTGSRSTASKRYDYARLVCSYMISQNLTCAEITSQQIARFYNLPQSTSRAIGHMLNFLYTNQIRAARFGFYIQGTRPLSKSAYPHRYSIQLIDGAQGLL